MPRMRGSAISGKPFRRGSLDLDTKAPLERIRSSVNLWFDKVFGDVRGAFLSKSKDGTVEVDGRLRSTTSVIPP